jgi:LmbE family N-acetylglucosaminyl deacetylase
VATLLCFHAHPDDEALSTGGLMAGAAAAGHRVVLVSATRGELGEAQPGVLAPGEALWQRREVELALAAEILGTEPPRFLGYQDSGMMGEATNANPKCFWQAEVAEAAERLAAIITEVDADVVTIYDEHGLYGHPDHIQVHRVGLAAVELAAVAHVYEATVNRDRALASIVEMEAELEGVEGPAVEDFEQFGVAEDDLSFALDVSPHLEAKRAAMRVHASQIPDDSFFLRLPPERFARMFAHEWYALPGVTGTGGPKAVDALPGL